MTTKLNLPTHLAEYLIGKFATEGSPVVRLPEESDLYHFIYDLLRKRPENVSQDSGNIEIVLPSPRKSHGKFGKPVETYNYIGVRGERILSKKVAVMMKAEAHDLFDENKHLNGIDYIDSSYYFLGKYNIESISAEALLKDYQRWRAKVRRHRAKKA